jgi:tRNA pseudouridine38-40 synthase
MRYALMVAYDGTEYYGFVRQPGVTTVEEVLLRSLRECGLLKSLRASRYQVAARTDRGVSALAQVVALDLPEAPDVCEINSKLPEDVTVLGAAGVDRDFNPRRDVISKHYRYVCWRPDGFDPELARRAAEMMEGEHDFRFFCAREPGKTTVGRILMARVCSNNHLTFDFVAPAFFRQQVRRMVEALLEVGTGRIDLESVRGALEGNATRSFRPAPPEGLFLANISYRRLLIQREEKAVERFLSYLRGRDDLRSSAMAKVLSGIT